MRKMRFVSALSWQNVREVVTLAPRNCYAGSMKRRGGRKGRRLGRAKEASWLPCKRELHRGGTKAGHPDTFTLVRLACLLGI